MGRKRSLITFGIRMALAAGYGVGCLASAQEAAAPAGGPTGTTGTHIRQPAAAHANPVLVVTREDLQATGLTSLGDVLQHLTISGAGQNTTLNHDWDGSVRLDLRNLGEEQVLVLVNGRRWITAPTLNAVDLQTIPLAIVERVEILKESASAIYGSDAVAGVVNVITRDDFTGAEANAYLGRFDKDDGDTTAAGFSIGASGERSRVFMNASYVKQEPVWTQDRAISAEPVFGTGNEFGGLASPAGLFTIFDPASGAQRPTFDNTDSFPGGAPLSAYRPFNRDTDLFNFAPDNYLLTPSERYSLYASGQYALSENVTFFAEGLFNKRESEQAEGSPVIGIGDLTGGDTVIPADNPFNPFGFVFGEDAGGRPYTYTRRLLEAGVRFVNQDVHTWQFTGGFQGRFELGVREWQWETYYQFARTDRSDRDNGLVSEDRLQQALLADCDPCVNLFGGAGGLTVDQVGDGGTISREAIDFITLTGQERFVAERNLYAAKLSGSPLALPAGPLGMSVGYEYRRDKGFERPDALVLAGGVLNDFSQPPTAGSVTAEDAWVEFAVPLLSRVPGAESLDLALASRRSDFDTFGSTTNSRVALAWRPNPDLLLRGSWSESFRAPSIRELFQERRTQSAGPVGDPCSDMLAMEGRNSSGGRDEPQPRAVIDRCVADGVPADGSYVEVSDGTLRSLGGDPRLGPETGESVTVGVAFASAFLDGLDVTLDYFDIELEDRVRLAGEHAILQGCYLEGFTRLCELVSRDPSTGRVIEVRDGVANLGSVETSGLDVVIDYAFPETPAGFFRLNWNSTYLEEYSEVIFSQAVLPPDAVPTVEEVDRAGTRSVSGAFPRWRSNLYLDWSRGDWSAVYGIRYIHHQDEGCGSGFAELGICTDPDHPDGPRNHLESVAYHDVQLSYVYGPWDSRFTLGARNLFDKGPPVCRSCLENSFDTATYDLPGRFWYARVTMDF